MSRTKISVRFQTIDALTTEFETNLTNGGTFISDAPPLEEREECDIEFIHPLNTLTLIVHARVVWIAPDNSGAGVAFVGFGPEQRDEIESFVRSTTPENTPILDAALEDPQNQSVHQRLRNLSVTEQLRIARSGNSNERIALERIYGKSVWEALLHNNKLTIPEVARIARMGALPKPLVETIVANPSWVASPPVRRALLTNPRLTRDQIPKVLKSMPQSELRLVPKQMAYTAIVRETARRLLKH
ncbi:MAG: PilZ domain-containing protein [Deltaproteobacteria bacterium]|nr:PilZ domain-containing protein [Deltaproteobacteria bacterium]MBN2673265.1 PilZ domain-containing protein [Deltaproteobacteria bacterium]